MNSIKTFEACLCVKLLCSSISIYSVGDIIVSTDNPVQATALLCV